MRDNELEKRKQQAYEHGQSLGYINQPIKNAEAFGYDPRSEEWDAFRDGYEDGKELSKNNLKTGLT